MASQALLLGIAAVAPVGLAAQGAVDPNIAPRAAALERAGDWRGATEMLGRYLATAPGDGRAWFQFGRMYLLAARNWHEAGHRGDPDGLLYLDLAALAFDHASGLQADSGSIYRGAVEMEKGIIRLEQHGWVELLRSAPSDPGRHVPGFVMELGANLVNSCPVGGILLPGNELEAVASWLALVGSSGRGDIFPFFPERYRDDSLYRRQATLAMGVPPESTPAAALSASAGRRSLCLTPGADTTMVPGPWSVSRLVLVKGRASLPVADDLSVTELLRARAQAPSAWTTQVESIYFTAARHNNRLCRGFLAYLKDPATGACGR